MEKSDTEGKTPESTFRIWRLAPWHILLGITLMALILRIYIVWTAAGINNDAYIYIMTARKMAREGLLAGMKGNFFFPYYTVNRGLILYPFLGRLLLPLAGDPVLALRLVSALAGVAMVPLGYAVANRLFKNIPLALLVACLLAVHDDFSRVSGAIYREALAAFVVLLAFYLVIRVLQSEGRYRYLWAFLCGLGLFMAFITRPETGGVALGCGIIVLFLAHSLKWSQRVKACVVMGVAFLILQVPWMYWMKQQTGDWMISQYQITKTLSRSEALEEHFEN